MKLADEYWEGTLRASPRWATSIGDRRYDALMEDASPEGKAREVARLEDLRARVAREAPSVTRSLLELQLRNDLDQLACSLEEWTVDPLNGPQVELLNLPEVQTVTTPEHARDIVLRWRAIGPWLDQVGTNLRRGAARGRFAVRDAVAKALTQLDDLLARPLAEWPLVKVKTPEIRGKLEEAVRASVKPAFERYRDLLRGELLPKARSSEKAGLGEIDPAAYRKLIRVHTALDLSPEEIHETGQAEVGRIRSEIESLGARLFEARTVEAVRERLAKDPAMFFATRDEVANKAEEALRRAEAAVPRHFRLLPKTPCVVKRMEAHEEKFSTLAYYRQPSIDGSRPGTYWINTSEPTTRTRYEAEALAFHEAVPGHHTQIAIQQELEGIAEFRKHTGSTAYVEGWALYTERLADEIGLYEGDLDRLGMFSFEAWRACRLVVDTGVHALGWSRQRALDFMKANTLLAENNIANEVDRYIVWPGQALAYKLGQLEILALRAHAKEKLGPRFDLRDFHDRVLEAGAVALPILRERVEEWVRSSGR
jgi:uncharacterized protein (DUF885 family)